jgi:hypothetical protein
MVFAYSLMYSAAGLAWKALLDFSPGSMVVGTWVAHHARHIAPEGDYFYE